MSAPRFSIRPGTRSDGGSGANQRRLPTDIAAGVVLLTLVVNGLFSPAGVTIAAEIIGSYTSGSRLSGVTSQRPLTRPCSLSGGQKTKEMFDDRDGRPWQAQLLRPVLVLCLSIAIPLLAAPEKPPRTYSEHGKIIDIEGHPERYGGGVYTDANGDVKSRPVRRVQVYYWTLLTTSVEYRIESTSPVRPLWMPRAKGAGNLADEVDFRIDKGMVYIQYGDKERRYRIVSERLVGKPQQ